MKRTILTALTVIFTVLTAHAKPLVLVTDRGQILVPTLKDWELVEKMFGMPFLYFSPQVNGQRSNISFTSTGVDTDVDLASLGKNQNSYKEIKTKWTESISAKATLFHPYKLWKSSQGHHVHQIGFEFEDTGQVYTETSFYVDCRGKLIFVKSLRLKENAQHQKDFENVVRELDCSL